MQLKIENLKSFISSMVFCLGLLATAWGQTTPQDSTLVITGEEEQLLLAQQADSVKTFQRFKADGIAAVVGDYLILESDILKMKADAKTQGMDMSQINDCQLVGRLMENKLYAHHAQLDSTIVVSADEINAMIDQQLDRMMAQVGDIEKVLAFYRKDTEADLREELFKINKERTLSSRMQDKIVGEMEVTPEEVRSFFNSIPEDERPLFGDEVEIAHLVIKPEVPQSEKQKVIDRLNEMRTDIVENGASFSTKAVLYSQDGTSMRGGQMSITRNDPLDKDFKQVAFSLQEGEVSKPFKTEFGYHIVQLDKIRGKVLDIRHIILIPQVTEETVQAARKKIDSIRTQIVNNEITFDEAARLYSEEKETKGDGGKLINPKSGDTRFELTDIDPLIYDQVNNLEEGEVSSVLMDQTRTGTKFFKLVTVNKKHEEHLANYAQDYTKIKELALREKQLKSIEKWQREKIMDTYIKISDDYKQCDFKSNWLKQ